MSVTEQEMYEKVKQDLLAAEAAKRKKEYLQVEKIDRYLYIFSYFLCIGGGYFIGWWLANVVTAVVALLLANYAPTIAEFVNIQVLYDFDWVFGIIGAAKGFKYIHYHIEKIKRDRYEEIINDETEITR